ncbi:MAG: HEAT repeat domain-containing protein [Planctomycetota bacterium]
MTKLYFFVFCALFSCGYSQEDIVAQLISKDPKIHLESLKKLKEVDSKELAKYAPALVQAALDYDKLVRSRAKNAIHSLRINTKSEISKIVLSLKHPNPEIQIDALDLLIMLGPEAEEAVPALILALQDMTYNVRYRTLAALGSIGTKAASAVPEMTKLYAKENWILKSTVINAVSSINPDAPELLPLLKDAFHHENLQLRQHALLITSRLGKKIVSLLPELLQALEEKNFRLKAIEALARIGPEAKEAIPALSKILEQSASSEENVLILEALSRMEIPLPELTPQFLKLLDDTNMNVRLKAAETMGRMNIEVEKVIPILITAIEHELEKDVLGIDAIQILGNIGTPAKSAISVLQKEFKKEDWFRRNFAAVSLGKIDASERDALLPIYLEILELRRDAEKGVKELPSHGAGGGKKRGKGNGSGGGTGGRKLLVEYLCAQSLLLIGQMGSKANSAIPAIQKLLEDKNLAIRENAAVALKQIRGEEK